MNNLFKYLFAAVTLFSANISVVQAELYEVTITNMTRGQILSPAIVVTHDRSLALFNGGELASPELAALAQDADSVGLIDLLSASSAVHEVVSGNDVILPGKSEKILINSHGNMRFISLVSMLVTTNDAFIAVNKLRLPRHHSTVKAPAYDAGAEANDELCAYIPGPPCGNSHEASDVEGEGFVHIHAGIHGIGDLTAAEHDWRNPVAKINIRRSVNNINSTDFSRINN